MQHTAGYRARSADDRPAPRWLGSRLPLRIERRTPSAWPMIPFGLGFVVVSWRAAGQFRAAAPEVPVLLWVVLGILALVGAGIALIGLDGMRARTLIDIDRRRVRVTRTGLWRTRRWSEPLAAYRGVLARSEHYPDSSGAFGRRGRTVSVLLLKHARRSERDVELIRIEGWVDLRGETERIARLLGRPVLTPDPDGGHRSRAVEDLDKSVAELAAEGRLELPEVPRLPLRGREVRSIRHPGGCGFEQRFTRLMRLMGTVQALVGLGLLAAYRAAGEPALVVFGAALVALGSALLVCSGRLLLTLRVDWERAWVGLTLGPWRLVERELPAAAIEEVRYGAANEGGGLELCADQGTLFFGPWLGRRELDRIRAEVLAVLAGIAPRAVAPGLPARGPSRCRPAGPASPTPARRRAPRGAS